MRHLARALGILTLAGLAGFLPAASSAQIGPDIAVSDIFQTRRWGEVGGITSYSIGTEICNLGDDTADWVAETNRHPVIAQNLYRLSGGRMEQVGLSWLKHGFSAVNGNACGVSCQQPGSSDLLGVGCSDPYDAFLNGDQEGFGMFGGGGLGPRAEVNATTGVFSYPYGRQGEGGDAIFKRLQVVSTDLQPDLNPGARYFVEAQYVTQDDAQAGNGNNNASYREVRVNGDLTLSFEAPTEAAKPAVYAWRDIDPSVEITEIDVAGDGRIAVAAKATDLGGGQWHYEYAVHNLNSHRSGASFQVVVPQGVTVSNVGFHDVFYHSGEPWDGADWPESLPGADGGPLRWATTPFDSDPTANAIRWSSAYNFRFDADAPPATTAATLGLHRPGSPTEATALTVGPAAAESCGGDITLGLTIDPLVAGQPADFTATGAQPGENVVFLASPQGAGCGLCPVPLEGLCLDVLPKAVLLGRAVADGSGTAVLTVNIPGGLGEIAAQAVVRRTGGAASVKSAAVVATP